LALESIKRIEMMISAAAAAAAAEVYIYLLLEIYKRK
jgi:hypothetical protein